MFYKIILRNSYFKFALLINLKAHMYKVLRVSIL